jgi:hypothetical protein
MTKVFDVFQVRIQKTHQLNHSIGICLPAVTVFDGQEVLHHFLYMAAILPHGQIISSCVVLHQSKCREVAGFTSQNWKFSCKNNRLTCGLQEILQILANLRSRNSSLKGAFIQASLFMLGIVMAARIKKVSSCLTYQGKLADAVPLKPSIRCLKNDQDALSPHL